MVQLKQQLKIKGCHLWNVYLGEIWVLFSRAHRILNHCLRRLRVCRQVRMTWGTICITPITSGSWVRCTAASVPIRWVVIPGPLVRVIVISWKSICWVCWKESIERCVNIIYQTINTCVCDNCSLNCGTLRKGNVSKSKLWSPLRLNLFLKRDPAKTAHHELSH